MSEQTQLTDAPTNGQALAVQAEQAALPLQPVASLIIPVYNEAPHLKKFFTMIDQLQLPIAKELVIVNDGSTDGSAAIVKEFAFASPVVIINQARNQGKGAAIRTGIKQATGSFIGIQDADFEYDPQDIPLLLQPLLDGKAEVVFGSRYKKTSYQVHSTVHNLVNRTLTLLSNALSG